MQVMLRLCTSIFFRFVLFIPVLNPISKSLNLCLTLDFRYIFTMFQIVGLCLLVIHIENLSFLVDKIKIFNGFFLDLEFAMKLISLSKSDIFWQLFFLFFRCAKKEPTLSCFGLLEVVPTFVDILHFASKRVWFQGN